ncbi:MAG TPA: hypothetical protein VII23_01220, partial [Terriglobales bacterium]
RQRALAHSMKCLQVQLMRLARNYFIAQPPELRPCGVPTREWEDRSREQLAKVDAIRRRGPEGIRDPRSITDPEIYARQRQREKEEAAAAAHERALEQMRALLSGVIEPIRRNSSKPTTIGEEREREQKKPQALAEARAENIRAQMGGWAGPKSTASEADRQPVGQAKEVA